MILENSELRIFPFFKLDEYCDHFKIRYEFTEDESMVIYFDRYMTSADIFMMAFHFADWRDKQ